MSAASSLVVMVIGLALFIGPHVLTSLRVRRAALIARFGDNPYKLAYSVISLLGVVLIAIGFARYRAAGMIPVWEPPALLRYIAAAMVLPAIILIVASYLRGHIFTVLRHPMLIGTVLWAFAHLLANGDLGSILLFGAVLAWAHYSLLSFKRRTDPGAPPMPNRGLRNDLLAVIVGTIAYLALFYVFHPLVIGVRVFGG